MNGKQTSDSTYVINKEKSFGWLPMYCFVKNLFICSFCGFFSVLFWGLAKNKIQCENIFIGKVIQN